MTCGRCNSHFCYRCGSSVRSIPLHTPGGIANELQISPQDPYDHYRRPGTSCFERLFDQEEIERFERETAMAHAGIHRPEEEEVWQDVRGIWEW